MLMRSDHISTHFVAYSMATRMYWLLNSPLASLIGLIKSNPHFKNGYSSRIITNLVKFDNIHEHVGSSLATDNQHPRSFS